jgi:hypothetical protein
MGEERVKNWVWLMHCVGRLMRAVWWCVRYGPTSREP